MRTLCLLSGLALLANVAACSSGGSPSQENLGTVSAAVSTTGPDGATYSVPTTDFLVVAQGGSVVSCDGIQSTTTQTTALPAGTYTFYLSTAAAGCVIPSSGDGGSVSPGTQVPFTLNRTTSVGTNVVTALLLTPAQTVTVGAGSTNALSFTFAIEQLGTISTGTGTVTTSINTDGGLVAATPTQGNFANTITMAYAPGIAPSGSSGANGIFSGNYSSAALTVAMSGISAFTATTSDSTCATFTPVVSVPTYTATTTLAQELSAPGAVGTICFGDQYTPSPNVVTVTINRTGAPVTSAFKSAFPNNADGGAPTLAFSLTTSAVASSQAPYNGLTLNLAAFAQTSQLSAPTNEGLCTIGFNGTLAGTLNFNYAGFVPTLNLAP